MSSIASYHFQPLKVRAFKSLTTPKEGCKIEKIRKTLLKKNWLVSKVGLIIDIKMGTCLKCEMTHPASRCNEKQSARLYIQHERQYLNLSAFDEILSAIAGTSNVTATTLLESKL